MGTGDANRLSSREMGPVMQPDKVLSRNFALCFFSLRVLLLQPDPSRRESPKQVRSFGAVMDSLKANLRANILV